MADQDWLNTYNAAKAKLTEQELSSISGKSFMFGRVGGWEDAAKFLLERSGQLYAQRKDAEAKMAREMSDALTEEARKKRAEWEKDYR